MYNHCCSDFRCFQVGQHLVTWSLGKKPNFLGFHDAPRLDDVQVQDVNRCFEFPGQRGVKRWCVPGVSGYGKETHRLWRRSFFSNFQGFCVTPKSFFLVKKRKHGSVGRWISQNK